MKPDQISPWWRGFLAAACWLALVPPALAQGLLDREWPRTDFSRLTVDLAEIESGGPPKDGIPAIDRPKFVGYPEADRWLHPKEPVIASEMRGEAKAYPLQILIYHEIVNDMIGGAPVAVTFCPLCNAAIVFDRRVEGSVLDFGTTGRLRMSDLVMYDRQSESWWQQFTGAGIVGRYAGVKLTQIPAAIVSYEDFQAAYPTGVILSRETGHTRPYGRNPYRGYDRIGQNPFLFRDPVDPRLPAMERVIGVSVKGKHRIYPFSVFRSEPVINDAFMGEAVVILSKEGLLSPLDQVMIVRSRTIPAASAFSRRLDGRALEFGLRDGRVFDRQTGSEWNLLGWAVAGKLKGRRLVPVESGVHFAFAWLGFRPESEIYPGSRAVAGR